MDAPIAHRRKDIWPDETGRSRDALLYLHTGHVSNLRRVSAHRNVMMLDSLHEQTLLFIFFIFFSVVSRKIIYKIIFVFLKRKKKSLSLSSPSSWRSLSLYFSRCIPNWYFITFVDVSFRGSDVALKLKKAESREERIKAVVSGGGG